MLICVRFRHNDKNLTQMTIYKDVGLGRRIHFERSHQGGFVAQNNGQ